MILTLQFVALSSALAGRRLGPIRRLSAATWSNNGICLPRKKKKQMPEAKNSFASFWQNPKVFLFSIVTALRDKQLFRLRFIRRNTIRKKSFMADIYTSKYLTSFLRLKWTDPNLILEFNNFFNTLKCSFGVTLSEGQNCISFEASLTFDVQPICIFRGSRKGRKYNFPDESASGRGLQPELKRHS